MFGFLVADLGQPAQPSCLTISHAEDYFFILGQSSGHDSTVALNGLLFNLLSQGTLPHYSALAVNHIPYSYRTLPPLKRSSVPLPSMNLFLDYLLKFFFLYTGLTTSLFSMSWLGSQGASFYARILTSYACLVVCSIYGFLAAILLRLVGLHRISQWATARAFKYTMRYSTGVRFNIISGKQHLSTRPCVIVGNHQTELDVLMLGEIFPRFCSVTAKKSLARAPFLGWFMSLSGTVFIDRKERTAALKVFSDAAEEMRRQRQSVFIFPEGTRSYAEEARLLDFKKGAFHLAIQAGVPVVPVVVCNYNGILNVKARLFRGGEIPIIGKCLGVYNVFHTIEEKIASKAGGSHRAPLIYGATYYCYIIIRVCTDQRMCISRKARWSTCNP